MKSVKDGVQKGLYYVEALYPEKPVYKNVFSGVQYDGRVVTFGLRSTPIVKQLEQEAVEKGESSAIVECKGRFTSDDYSRDSAQHRREHYH